MPQPALGRRLFKDAWRCSTPVPKTRGQPPKVTKFTLVTCSSRDRMGRGGMTKPTIGKSGFDTGRLVACRTGLLIEAEKKKRDPGSSPG